MKKLELTLVCEGTTTYGSLLGEYGLAWLIRTDTHTLLYDTGQGLALENNSEELNIDLSKLDAVLLSHGHYDHVGGLADVFKYNRKCPVYAHASSLVPKFCRTPNGNGRNLNIPLLCQKSERAKWEKRLRLVDGPTEIIPGVFTTGTIPRVAPFERTGNGSFYLDRNLEKADPMLDDLSVYFETPKGTCVIVGCAHSGIINTLLHVKKLTNNKPIYAIYGGMHLSHAKLERIERTVRELRHLDTPTLYPNHCTGMAAIERLYYAFPGKVHAASTGMHWAYRLS
jgi:7,8-dihydropterin-6-yl-methyl-4-(beta-D-ribofuranosyl)aminobenzene 5'-phosphate synthase